jgi:hypothetical protein
MIASLGGDFSPPQLMDDLNLICSVVESWCDQLSVCCYLQKEQQGCLRSVLATLVFISTKIEVPHVIKRLSHVYAVIEQTMVQSMLSSQSQCMFMQSV